MRYDIPIKEHKQNDLIYRQALIPECVLRHGDIVKFMFPDMDFVLIVNSNDSTTDLPGCVDCFFGGEGNTCCAPKDIGGTNVCWYIEGLHGGIFKPIDDIMENL